MNVTIIGAGNMGRGIGHRLVAGGHDVTVVDRDPEEYIKTGDSTRRSNFSCPTRFLPM
jgi:Trk K+ transport system NAD-binding subunit